MHCHMLVPLYAHALNLNPLCCNPPPNCTRTLCLLTTITWFCIVNFDFTCAVQEKDNGAEKEVQNPHEHPDT